MKDNIITKKQNLYVKLVILNAIENKLLAHVQKQSIIKKKIHICSMERKRQWIELR